MQAAAAVAQGHQRRGQGGHRAEGHSAGLAGHRAARHLLHALRRHGRPGARAPTRKTVLRQRPQQALSHALDTLHISQCQLEQEHIW